MSGSPRSYGGPQMRDVRDSARRQARAVSGVTIALLGSLFAAVTMVLVVVLDYQFHQPIHRVIKLLLAGGLGISVLFVPWAGLLAFPVVAPFLPWIPPVPVPGVNALNLMLGTVFVTWCVGRVQRGEAIVRAGRLSTPLILMILLIVLAVVRGAAFPTGYHYEVKDGVVQAIRACVTLAVYFVTLYMARGETSRRRLVWALVLGLLFESVATILLGRNGRGGRATGSIGQSNDLGAFLAVFTVVAAAMLPAVRGFLGRLTLLAATVAGCYGILLSVSRAAMVAVGLGLFYVALRSSRTFTVLLLLVAATSPLWAPDYVKDRIMGTSVDAEEGAELESGARLRVDTWRAIIEVVSDHPIEGVGFGGLQYVLPQTGEALGVDVKDSSHNTFLRMLGEMGVIGLGLFLWVLWACWGVGNRTIQRAKTRFDRQLGVGLGAATLALVASCAFGDRFFNVLVAGGFWMLVALAEDSQAPVALVAPVVPVGPAGAPLGALK